MAYAVDPLTAQRKKQEELAIGAGAVPAAATVSAAPGAAPATAPAQPAQPQNGTGFVNLSRYVDQNQGGAQAMAGRLGDKAESAAQGATQGLAGLQNTYQQQAAAGTTNYSAPGALVAPHRPGGGGPLNSYIPPAQGPEAVAAANTAAGATYTGPRSMVDLGDYGKVASATRDASSQLQGLQNPYALGDLLGGEYGAGPGYRGGGKELDSFLTAQAGAQRFGQLSDQYKDLEKNFGTVTADTSAADKARATTDASRQAAQGFLGTEAANTQARGEVEATRAAAAAEDQRNAELQDEYARFQQRYRQGANPIALANMPTYDQWLNEDIRGSAQFMDPALKQEYSAWMAGNTPEVRALKDAGEKVSFTDWYDNYRRRGG